jgi:hypothetical protein
MAVSKIRTYGPRLAGFPVHVCYVDLRGEHGPDRATYYFDPRTFSEDLEVRRMQYYARRESRFWVEVVICKIDRRIEVGKYRDERLVSAVRWIPVCLDRPWQAVEKNTPERVHELHYARCGRRLLLFSWQRQLQRHSSSPFFH